MQVAEQERAERGLLSVERRVLPQWRQVRHGAGGIQHSKCENKEGDSSGIRPAAASRQRSAAQQTQRAQRQAAAR